MRKLQAFTSFALFGAGLLFSCSDTDTFEPLPNLVTVNNQAASGFFSDLASPAKAFQFNAAIEHTFALEDGSLITFKPNSFAMGGKIIGNRSIRASIRSFGKKRDMVSPDVSTLSDSLLTESAGIYQITADMEGIPLELAAGCSYRIRIPLKDPSAAPRNLEVFYGSRESGKINWKQADNDPSVHSNVITSEWKYNDSLQAGLSFISEKLGWVNCGRFLRFEGQEKTEVCLLISTVNQDDEITFGAYSIPVLYNSIGTACCKKGDLACFDRMPLDEAVRFVLIGKGKKDYYLGHADSRIKNNEVISIRCAKVPLDDIRTFLHSL